MLSLIIRSMGNVTIFHCDGRITADSRNSFLDLVLAHSGRRVIVLDLGRISVVDAAGLGTLISLRAWAQRIGKELKLMNLTTRVEELLELTNLRSVFEVCSAADITPLMERPSRSCLVAESNERSLPGSDEQ